MLLDTSPMSADSPQDDPNLRTEIERATCYRKGSRLFYASYATSNRTSRAQHARD